MAPTRSIGGPQSGRPVPNILCFFRKNIGEQLQSKALYGGARKSRADRSSTGVVV